YATRYYTLKELKFEDLEKEEQDAILALQGERFIGSRRTLNEAWDNRTRTLNEIDDDTLSQDGKEFTEALRIVIKAGSTENAQQMADALSSTAGVVDGLRRTLHRERLPKCCDPVIVKGFLIAQDLSNSSELDLSWMQLSPAQVLKVVRAVLQDDSFKICSLDISGNSDVSEGTLSDIFKLPKAGEIKRLYLFGCPKVENVRRADMAGRIGMEEGTEIYIIANVLGRYRIVAVYHLQSLYPPEAVHLAWTLLQHIKQHAGPLEKELRCLQEGRYTKNDAEYPFYAGEDNNSGYTVVDVTDPFSPAYCFWGAYDWYGFQPGDPIDPEGYATRYYTDEKLEFEDLKKEEQDAILALQGSRHTLNEAWDNWSPTLDEMDEEAPSRDARKFTETLRTIIKAGSTENAQQMADALSSSPGVVEGLRRTLRQKRLPKCCDPIIVKGFLIAQDLSKSNELDLSWMQLSPAQVLKVVRAVLQDDSFKVLSLNISGNLDVTEGTLSDIIKLPKAGEIKRLYLFGCPKVEDVRRADMPRRIGMEEGAE
ncbi:hypothetical protein FRC00_009497, partial [Tulasnella sp. 408]